MKEIKWVCWLLLVCVCLVEARYKMRRPLGPPPPPPSSKILVKKSWPMSHRISMGNPMHMPAGYPPKRISHNPKPTNYRHRRPPAINILPSMWKNPVPVRATLNNHAVLPNRPPIKEFHSMNKVPEYSPEYSPEYRPETSVFPATHRGGVDDDKGPIHTIPAPNLSIMDRPYNAGVSNEGNYQRQRPSDSNAKPNVHGPHPPNFDLPTLGTSSATQRTITSPTPSQHQYEVTESNDIGQSHYPTVLPTFLPPDFDVSRLNTLVNPDLQTNDVFVNSHPGANIGLMGPNIQFGQPNPAMQTNLHSSLHVGFPGSASQAPYMLNQQIPELHVGHPAPAGPPLSATQLYDLLNSFPQQFADQYQAGQHPQFQQHILQQQLGQIFQPGAVAGFSQPQMHTFNYEEQDSQEQQQQQEQQQSQQQEQQQQQQYHQQQQQQYQQQQQRQQQQQQQQQRQQQQQQYQQQQQQQQQQYQQQQPYFFGPEYIQGKVNTDYKVGTDILSESQENAVDETQDVPYASEVTEQAENNIEYEESNNRGQTTYFNKVTNNGGGISSQFYTTLPNREAAEKLAALAAAGNVNSQLIGKLRQQQEQQQHQQQEESAQSDQAMPSNHKDDVYEVEENPKTDKRRYHEDNKYREQQSHDQEQMRQTTRPQTTQSQEADKPLRIMVPDDADYPNDADHRNNSEMESGEFDYEYESDEAERNSEPEAYVDFGTRIRSKN